MWRTCDYIVLRVVWWHMMGVENMRLHGSKGRVVAYDGCGGLAAAWF